MNASARRLSWNLATRALVASALVLLLATPIRAASSGASEAVCNVSADYALGVEDYPEAIRLHEQVVRHDPNDALAHYHLGFAYGMSHNAAGELREYQRAEHLGLREWDLFLNLGLLYLENGNTTSAIDALRTATRLGPQHSEAHFDLSLAYERAGRLSEALTEILDSLKIDPDQPDAQNTLAVIYAGMGNNNGARAVWTKLIRIDPDYQPARRNFDFFERATANEASELRPNLIADSSPSSR
ncbi:MAG: tetratricopeptide repeat protein [Candidatus Binatus sp.]|uniref:tetratricopeptide repeat protein n=1 Tax=Candidatus Binatus sp. TaxID=2811406 RepID=UPI003BB14C96